MVVRKFHSIWITPQRYPAETREVYHLVDFLERTYRPLIEQNACCFFPGQASCYRMCLLICNKLLNATCTWLVQVMYKYFFSKIFLLLLIDLQYTGILNYNGTVLFSRLRHDAINAHVTYPLPQIYIRYIQQSKFDYSLNVSDPASKQQNALKIDLNFVSLSEQSVVISPV